MDNTVRKAIKALTPSLGAGEARAVAENIFHWLKGWSRTDMLIHDDTALSPFIREKVEEAVARILKGEPVQYVTGEAYFYGMWLHVDSRVLILRPETAELVDMIADWADGRADLRALDIGTGSGCIAIALARTLRFPVIKAIDISQGALHIAEKNAKELKADITLEEADMLSYSPEPDSLDIVVSNPPYIDESERSDMEPTVKDFEPETALFVPDSDPLKFYRPIAETARKGLRPGGKLFLEINPRHAESMLSLLSEAGFSEAETHLDIHGKKRFATAIQPTRTP